MICTLATVNVCPENGYGKEIRKFGYIAHICYAVPSISYNIHFITEEHQALKHTVRHCEVCFRRSSSCRVEHAFSDYQRFSTGHLLIYSYKQLRLMFTQMSEKKWGILYFKYKTNSKSWTTSTKWGREKFWHFFLHRYRASWYYASFFTHQMMHK
jgi:hypothetical protein